MIRPQASKPGSGSRFRGSFGRQKPSFLENFRATLSGPQHLPIAKNEEAKRHDRGTIAAAASNRCTAQAARSGRAASRRHCEIRKTHLSTPVTKSAQIHPKTLETTK